jgi:hypothetical protein
MHGYDGHGGSSILSIHIEEMKDIITSISPEWQLSDNAVICIELYDNTRYLIPD